MQSHLDEIGKSGDQGAANVLRRLAAEGLGSLLLAATVIGCGIMAAQLSAHNDGCRPPRKHVCDGGRARGADKPSRASQRRTFQSGRVSRPGIEWRDDMAPCRRSCPSLRLLPRDAPRTRNVRLTSVPSLIPHASGIRSVAIRGR